MKKLLAALLIVVFTLALAGCGGKVTPEKAFSNLKDATQGTIAAKLTLSGDMDNEKINISTNFKAIFGMNTEKSKMGFAMGIDVDLGQTAQTEQTIKVPSKIAGMAKVYYDGTQAKKQLDVTAGIDKATAEALGQGLKVPIMITMNYDDLKTILGDSLNNFGLAEPKDKDAAATAAAEELKIKTLLLEQFKDFNLPEPKDKGEATIELSGVQFTGNQYDYELTEAVVRDIIKRCIKFQNEAVKTSTAIAAAGASQSINQADVDKSLNELDLSKPSILTLLVDKEGFIGYASVKATLKSKTEPGYLDVELAFGSRDFAKNADGTEYYKTTSEKELPNYKDAMIIPGTQITDMFGGLSGLDSVSQ